MNHFPAAAPPKVIDTRAGNSLALIRARRGISNPMKSRQERTCRRCGCTNFFPCVDKRTGVTCCWVERNLCLFCLTMPELKRWRRGEKNPSQGRP
jgi:hypothetical protein